MVERSINFYGGNFERLYSIPITRPLPACWVPDGLDNCDAIQAVSNGVLVGQASMVHTVWHYNLVGGPSHTLGSGVAHDDSIREIVSFFVEAMLLSAAEHSCNCGDSVFCRH